MALSCLGGIKKIIKLISIYEGEKESKKEQKAAVSQSIHERNLLIQQSIALRPWLHNLMTIPPCQRTKESRDVHCACRNKRQSGLVTPASASGQLAHTYTLHHLGTHQKKNRHPQSIHSLGKEEAKKELSCDNDRIRTCAAEAI